MASCARAGNALDTGSAGVRHGLGDWSCSRAHAPRPRTKARCTLARAEPDRSAPRVPLPPRVHVCAGRPYRCRRGLSQAQHPHNVPCCHPLTPLRLAHLVACSKLACRSRLANPYLGEVSLIWAREQTGSRATHSLTRGRVPCERERNDSNTIFSGSGTVHGSRGTYNLARHPGFYVLALMHGGQYTVQL